MRRQVWQRTRGHRALALALALHALVFSLARNVTRASAPAQVAQSRPEPADEFDVEFGDAATAHALPAAAEPAAGADPAAAATPSKLAFATKRLASSRADAAAPSESAEAAETEATEAIAANEDGADVTPTAPIDLGLGADGWQRWVGSSAAESTASSADGSAKPKPRARFRAPTASTTGGLQEGLEEHDRALGLSASGRVRTALFQAAHTDVAPQLGVALFQVTVLRSGAVEVSLHSASSEDAGWQAVAVRAAEELRKKPPRIPPSREGARLLVEIKAESTFPNGLKAAQQESIHVEATPPRFRSTEDAQADLKARNPVAATTPGAEGLKPNVELPGVYIAQRGKVCGYRVGISALGPILQGGCDLTNIGAKAARMVHTRVREESLF